MAGKIKLDGTQFLEKVNNEFKITNSEIKLKSTGNTIVDSSGNAVVSESGGNITISNSAIKLKSSGNSITKSDGTTAVLSESGGVVTLNNGTIGSGVVFPAGHMIFREIQSEYNPQNAGGTRTNAITTLGVTPLSTTSKFLVSYYGTFSAGSNTAGTGATGILFGKYSLNSDMSSATEGGRSSANYFNSTSGSTTVTEASSTFYIEFELTHNGNTYYFNADVNKYGLAAYLRPINLMVKEVF